MYHITSIDFDITTNAYIIYYVLVTINIVSNASHRMSFRSYAKSQTNSITERLALLKLTRDRLVDALATGTNSLDEKSKTDSS